MKACSASRRDRWVGLRGAAGIAGAAESQLGGSNSPGLGGAGAFIPPAHVNGPFAAGGPCAGVGGAGAVSPPDAPAPLRRLTQCGWSLRSSSDCRRCEPDLVCRSEEGVVAGDHDEVV